MAMADSDHFVIGRTATATSIVGPCSEGGYGSDPDGGVGGDSDTGTMETMTYVGLTMLVAAGAGGATVLDGAMLSGRLAVPRDVQHERRRRTCEDLHDLSVPVESLLRCMIRAGLPAACTLTARVIPCVQSRHLAAAMDAVIRNTKDGVGTTSVVRDSVRESALRR
jgi:hypothetical protein